MTYFSIEILYGESREWTKHVGRIMIDDLDEDITLQTETLSFEEYESHWKREVKAIVSRKKLKSFLLNVILSTHTDEGDVVWGFPMYRVGQNVYFQNVGYFRNHLKTPWDIQHPERIVDDRPLIDRKLGTCSEWVVPVSALADWLKREEKKEAEKIIPFQRPSQAKK